MPYIDREDRKVFDSALDNFPEPRSAGELNYVITRLCHRYLNKFGRRYGVINEIIGVLACASMELYRRIAAPYEDSKIEENGDVQP